MNHLNFNFAEKPLVQKAWGLAMSHHAGITRRYTGEPYIRHPERVVSKLLSWGLSCDDNLAAAFLHDCVEDPNRDGNCMPIEMIRQHLNGRVMSKVDALTRRKNEANDSYTRRLSRCEPSTRTIKLADILDNCVGLAEKDPEYAARYLPKKIEQASLIGVGVSSKIRAEVNTSLNSEMKFLQRAYLDQQAEIQARNKRIEEEFQDALLSVELDLSAVAQF